MADQTTLTGEVVLEYLEKWPDIPNNALAKLIYNDKDNYKLFRSKESVRGIIRYYKGQAGDKNRKDIRERKFVQNK